MDIITTNQPNIITHGGTLAIGNEHIIHATIIEIAGCKVWRIKK